jgi:hypothetical protein
VSKTDRWFRAIGVGLTGTILVWLVSLSIIFISEDASHAKAHLTQQRGQVAWIGFVIVFGCMPLLFTLLRELAQTIDGK